MQAWRKRFFCLRSSKVLEYYKSVDGDLKGVVNLEDCKAVHADLSHKKYKHVFDIETRDRTYYFVASSAEDMKNWVDTICHVCAFSLQSSTVVIGEWFVNWIEREGGKNGGRGRGREGVGGNRGEVVGGKETRR